MGGEKTKTKTVNSFMHLYVLFYIFFKMLQKTNVSRNQDSQQSTVIGNPDKNLVCAAFYS